MLFRSSRLRRYCASCRPTQLHAWRARHNHEWNVSMDYKSCTCVRDFKNDPDPDDLTRHGHHSIHRGLCFGCLGKMAIDDNLFWNLLRIGGPTDVQDQEASPNEFLRWYCPCGRRIGDGAVVICGWCDGMIEWRVEEYWKSKISHVYNRGLEKGIHI